MSAAAAIVAVEDLAVRTLLAEAERDELRALLGVVADSVTSAVMGTAVIEVPDHVLGRIRHLLRRD